MSDSVAAEIDEEQRRRHANNPNQNRCKRCGSFVSKGRPNNGQLRYQCKSCGRAILEYVAPKQATRS